MNALVPRENQPLQTALSASSRTSLASKLADVTNVTTVRALLAMTPASLRSWLAEERAKIGPSASSSTISAHLAKLIPHYWQPDMTDAQMRSRFLDFCSDLDGVTEAGMAAACAAYRRDPKNSFFPTPGKLLALCADDIRDRRLRILAIDNAAHAITLGLAAEPDTITPLPKADEILRKHGHPPVFGKETERPSTASQEPVSQELRDLVARRSAA